MRITREEIFGPVASTRRVKDYDEALAIANDGEFGLSAGIVDNDRSSTRRTSSATRGGHGAWQPPDRGSRLPRAVRGRKGSSYGPREQGRYAAEFFTTVKTAYTAP